ncbi:hypothetical protein PCASD_06447 [Puccinia coronata f. sp. avenae]|uniref:Uncharacterized protein n=1 Tax=Puccinia coronata f. sp. avenae TaxID=200324 RepID=A0A2N5UFJ3_9BASI|nr:hypothetical protein PCASD_06447 [Puccinia coronata f. sp. avenae]
MSAEIFSCVSLTAEEAGGHCAGAAAKRLRFPFPEQKESYEVFVSSLWSDIQTSL